MSDGALNQTPDRRWTRAAAVLLFAFAVFGAVIWWQWPPASPTLTVRPDVMPWRAEQTAEPPDWHDLSAAATVGQLLMRSGDTPTDREPADLPVPEALGADSARREAGWIRRQRGVIEAMSLWYVHAPDVDELASSYNEAARAAGFTVVSSDTTPRTVTLLFHRPAPDAPAAAHEVLTIRLSLMPDAGTTQGSKMIRVLVWLRTPTLD